MQGKEEVLSKNSGMDYKLKLVKRALVYFIFLFFFPFLVP